MAPTKFYGAPKQTKRPYKSFRFDVFSLKAGRRMTLFGKPALSLFIELEADSTVTGLCERPLEIPDLKPTRCVDFWAVREGRPHFYLLVSSSEARDLDKRKLPKEEFRKWVGEQNGFFHEVINDALTERHILHSNWSTILQHLVAHRGQVPKSLVERCAMISFDRMTLSKIENAISDEETMLVRAAAFTLLAGGHLICPTISSDYLNGSTFLVRP